MTRKDATDQFLCRIRDLVHRSDRTWMQIKRDLEPEVNEFVRLIEAELCRIA